MKTITDKNSHTLTPSGTLLQPEQAIPDTNDRKEFQVEFHGIDHKTAFVTIYAKSLRDAKRKAEAIGSEHVTNWEVKCDQIYVFEVVEVGKEKRHD